MNTNLAVSNPNLSIILPVGCNARCTFCYWEKGTGLTPAIFNKVATTLPESFRQISITGGETTIAKDFTSYLKIAYNNYDKVVLNTNGCALHKLDFQFIHHVNISRHHWIDSENNKIFNTTSVPDTSRLKELCSYGDVTLNCVLAPKFKDYSFILSYIAYAKTLGAKVSFRKYYGNLDILTSVDLENTLNWEHSCSACKTRNHTINDVDVSFKYTVKEPLEVSDGIYELILQSNGELTADWAGTKKLQYKE